MPYWIPGVPNPVFSPKSLPFRPTLSTSTLLYVRSDGNDNNSGFSNSASGAKATWNNAYTTAAAFDFNNQTVTLLNGNAAAYTTGLWMRTPWVGGGGLVIDLNGGAINAQTTSVPNKAILSQMAIPTSVTVQNGTLTAQVFSGLQNAGVGVLQLGTGMTFGSCGSYQMEASAVGAIIAGSGVQFTVSGGGGGLYGALFGGQIFMVSATALITTNVTYSVAFAVSQSLSQLLCQFATFSTGAFTVSGLRFSVSDNAVIGTGGTNSATFLPGTVAGTATTGGQYT